MARGSAKLAKLKVLVYGERKRRGPPQAEFEAMFNPASFSMRHANRFDRQQGIDTTSAKANYINGRSDALRLELVLDGSGVADATAGGGKADVASRVERFLDLCLRMDGNLHEPRFLKIQWGKGPLSDFDCRLLSVDIRYTSFEIDGAPRRAVLDATFVQDLDPDKRVRKERKRSPDLTHRRQVVAGDTLPGLCLAVYGSAEHYLTVARANDLDQFRDLEPGRELLFPPLTNDKAKPQ